MKIIINLIFNVIFLIFIVKAIVDMSKNKKKKMQKLKSSQVNEKIIKKYNDDINNIKELVAKNLDRKKETVNVKKDESKVTLFSNVEKIEEREINKDSLEEDYPDKNNSNDFDFGHMDRNEIIKGIVFSEILEKPKALRRLRWILVFSAFIKFDNKS